MPFRFGFASDLLTIEKYIEKPGEFHVIVPENTGAIKSGAFKGCSNLKSVTIPSSVVSIGNYAFKDCVSLEKLDFSEGLKTLGTGSFDSCKRLKSVRLPDSLEFGGINTFMGCDSLRHLRIPHGLKSYSQGFASCRALKTVEIGGCTFSVRFGDIHFSNDQTLEFMERCVREPAYIERKSYGYHCISPEVFYTFAVELFLYGSQSAEKCIRARYENFFETAVLKNDVPTAEILLSLYNENFCNVINKMIDLAAVRHHYELYITLAQFRHDTMGEFTERFEL